MRPLGLGANRPTTVNRPWEPAARDRPGRKPARPRPPPTAAPTPRAAGRPAACPPAGLLGELARHGHDRARGERDRRRDPQPLDVVVKRDTGYFPDPPRGHVERGDAGGRAEQQVVAGHERRHALEDGAAGLLGLRDPFDGEAQPELDVPDDVGLETVAVGRIQRLHAGDEPGAAQHLECLWRLREVGRRLLHLDPGRRQSLHRPAAGFANLAGDRCHAAQIGGVSDPRRQRRRGGRVGERTLRRFQRQRVARVESGHRVQHQRRIGNRAAHRPLHRHRPERQRRGAGGHPAGAGPDTHDAAEAGRGAHAAPEVGTGRQPHLAAGQGGGRATRRATAGAGDVPRVPGLAEHLVERVGAGPELGRVRLRHDHGATLLEALDHEIRPVGHVVCVDRGAVGGTDAGHVVEILDGDRQSGKRHVAGGAARPVKRPLGANRGQRVQLRVDLLDPPQRRIHQLPRRDLARAQQRDRFDGGQHAQVVGHARQPTGAAG